MSAVDNDLDVKSFRPKTGCKRSPEYNCWANLRQRCNNFLNPSFADYGARGITVCPEWDSFDTFLQDMGPRPTKKHSIERKDNDKGYCKDNCVWATKKVQQNNRRSNIEYEHDGQSHTVGGWSEIVGISENTLFYRIYRGWTIERALTTPVRKRRKKARLRHTPVASEPRRVTT